MHQGHFWPAELDLNDATAFTIRSWSGYSVAVNPLSFENVAGSQRGAGRRRNAVRYLKGSQPSPDCRHDLSIGRPLATLFVEHRCRQNTQARISALHAHDEERANNTRPRCKAFVSAGFCPPPQPRSRCSISHDASKLILVFIVRRLEWAVDTQEEDYSRPSAVCA